MRRLKVVSTSPLPPLYDAWMAELLAGPIPAETEATCDDCAMCAPGATSATERSFDPRVKCCTYLPALPNFLVGRILADRDVAAREGRKTVEARMRRKVAVTPLGLGAPSPNRALYHLAAQHSGFGRTPSLRCPHYLEDNGGKCGIWNNRMSVCATWFCKHVRGAVGMDFWRSGIEPLLAAVEAGLARWCVLELDPGLPALQRLFRPRIESGRPNLVEGSQLRHEPEVYRKDWGTWLGKERAFYVESARKVSSLRWADVMKITGVEVRARARLVRALYEQLMSEDIPASLRAGELHIAEMGGAHTRVTTYNSYDPLDLPAELLPLLARFDGRPTRKVIADVEASDGVELDDGLLRKLVDFEILVVPDAERRTQST